MTSVNIFKLKLNKKFTGPKQFYPSRVKSSGQHFKKVTCSSKKIDVQSSDRPTLIDTSRRQLMMGTGSAVLGTFGLCACNFCGTGPALAFDYGEIAGPPSWSGICREGQSQSPVNIDTDLAILNPTAQSYFKFAYAKQPKAFVNSGHGAMVTYEPGSYATIGKRKLELLQFHFHTPSEHTIDGKHSQMEVHLVHKDVDSGLLCVLGTMMIAKKGAPTHAALQAALDNTPVTPQAERAVPCGQVDLTSFISPGSGFWNYSGSLTTPPCSEEVNWFVFSEPIFVAPEQVLEFQELLGNGTSLNLNYRPVANLNARNVSYYSFANRGAARF
eukprot:CAMPEP_0196572098 /NCGR_PEP_ID=MMETSP1081-20130531/2207_1 /TAXON_ID=36882 /ORGANISM="Pyramimonas amylifera, Strain CCMP720" /LENGTH=327 /DNA_ID=CAMNT_0041889297 /DNA_START=98 /DNA_END=1081 /DNA_ORIENTATION=-